MLCPEVPDDGGECGGGELHALALVAAEEAGQVVAPLVLLHVPLRRLGYLEGANKLAITLSGFILTKVLT